MSKESIIISGIGMITPEGVNGHACLTSRCQNENSFNNFDSQVIRIQPNITTERIASSELKKHTRLSIMVIESIYRCLCDAGLSIDALAESDTGIITASYFGCLDTLDKISQSIYENHQRNSVNPIDFSKATHSFPAAMAMINFKFKGPVVALVSTYSAGLDALHLATSLIRSGKARKMIVIGYEELPALAEKYLVDTGIVNANAGVSLTTPACEGCAALLLENKEEHKTRECGSSKAIIHKIKSNGFDLEDPTRCIYDSISSACSYTHDGDLPYLISQGSELDNGLPDESIALTDIVNNGVVAKSINLKTRIGNYLGAAGLIEIGIAVSAINHKQTEWLSYGKNFFHDETRFVFNSYDVRGNVTSAVLTANATN